MQTLSRFLAVTGLCLLSALSCLADGVRYTVRGTFPATTPTGPYSAPNGRFTLTFLVTSTVPNYTPSGQPFSANAPIYNGTYTLNGTATAFTAGGYHAANSANNAQTVTLTGNPNPPLGFTALGSNNGLVPLLTPPDAQNQSHFALTGLGSASITLNLVDASGAALNVPVQATFSAAVVPGVTISIVGSWPAGIATTPYCAPLRQFLLEVMVRTGSRFGTGAFALPIQFVNYTYNGQVTPGGVGSYVSHADFASQEAIALVNPNATLVFYTTFPTHAPILFQNAGGFVSIPLGALGTGTNWACYVAPVNDPAPVNTFFNLLGVSATPF